MGEFMDWCKEGLKRAGVVGQLLIVDSSTDNTARIVLEHGGEVLRTPKRGVGRAYLDAIPYVRGKWVLMGDADLTYDFREIAPFVEEFRKGAEFVMGSRFLGSIETGAMPKLHRYFGTPLTNWILNRIYRSNYSDIHCGIRGVTRDALDKINITSEGWVLLLVNVPTWSGKRFLELSAFRLGFSPKVEIDDHKMYYDKRDLWPMLVRTGFKPSRIRMRYHKFGLNLFAAAREDDADQHN